MTPLNVRWMFPYFDRTEYALKVCLFFVGPRSILGGHWFPLFLTSCNPSHGFQSQGGSLTCTLTCLCTVNLRVTSGATPAFSTNRGVHCISMCTASPPTGHPLYKQQRTGSWLVTWAAVPFNLGTSGAWHALRPISIERKWLAIVIATSLSKLYRTIAIAFAQWKQS